MPAVGSISARKKGVATTSGGRTRLGAALAAGVVAGLLVPPSTTFAAERQTAGRAAGEVRTVSNGPECLRDPRGTARIVSMPAADSVVLDDGRVVRLATVSAPAPLVPTAVAAPIRGRADFPDGPAADVPVVDASTAGVGLDGSRTPTDRARAMLAALIEGRSVAIHPLSTIFDRHGRLRAHLVTEDGRSVAALLVEAGLLRVEPGRDDFACARVLLPLEAEARAAGRGFWAEPSGSILSAEDPALAEKAGRYAIVEGRVLSTGRAGTRTYLNFGRRFASDFTAVIDDKEMQRFQTAGYSPARLEGRTIRVRGWLTARDGGFMALSVPEEIEWVR